MTSTALPQSERASFELVSGDDARVMRRNRRIIVPRYGAPGVMTLIEQPLPEPGPGEVRVRIVVAGVGYPDVLIREGTYPGGPKPPFTPGYEFIGIVDKLGGGVEAFRLGQRVGAVTVYGSHADYLCVPAWWLVPVPDSLDPAEAAIVVFNYMTAYQMLHAFPLSATLILLAALFNATTGRLPFVSPWITAIGGVACSVFAIVVLLLDWRVSRLRH